MKDQQIDALALYKAYYRFLQEEPRDTAGDLRETNPHRINIRHFENMVRQEKENLLGSTGMQSTSGTWPSVCASWWTIPGSAVITR